MPIHYWHSTDSLGWPFPMLKYYIFWNKIYGSNFIKQHSETVMVWNYQNTDCSFKNKFILLFIVIFCTLSFPVQFMCCERSFMRLLGRWRHWLWSIEVATRRDRINATFDDGPHYQCVESRSQIRDQRPVSVKNCLSSRQPIETRRRRSYYFVAGSCEVLQSDASFCVACPMAYLKNHTSKGCTKFCACYDVRPIHRVTWRHKITDHDTIAILWV